MLTPTYCESFLLSLPPLIDSPPPRYLDQPRYVGYSFGYGQKVKSSVEAADDFVTFYQGWLDLFPEFKGRELIISGESYGGHYVSPPSLLSSRSDYLSLCLSLCLRSLLGRMPSWTSTKSKPMTPTRSTSLVL
jgi:hypothetical protein